MKKLITSIIITLGIYGIMLSPSCDYGYVEPVIINIPDTVSFADNIVPILKGSCATSGCHISGGIAPDLSEQNAHLDLWTYGFVDTANAESSILYVRMASTSNPMPPVGKLTDDKVQLVLAWIKQGAQEN